ncbi:glycosyltransferase [Ferribacterium limneticum]|uniref:glycosyltransferase n=1 Tax=Ferribacterium limneticum TaxID=76259 RepID=UPI001CFAA08C|nr:glycosyltransferase [Ferribacterium limneticum]UCV17309.1 glycosyltransferase [Ferribacterium limneticum]
MMIAYHFPPLVGSSGIQRTLGFARALPALGWQPAILSAHPRAYEQARPEQPGSLPDSLQVHRAFALDTSRHLAFFGRYPLSMALPDRWVTWLLGAIPAGLAMICQLKPAVLWSTYPIATAHLIGYWLARVSGLPWVADFRDPMAHEGYPPDQRAWQSFLKVEQRVFSRANLCVFATEGAAQLYRKRYPRAADRIRVIENGYDEADFVAAETNLTNTPLNPGAFTLLHSGIVYPEWRNPIHLLQAIRQLLDVGRIDPASFRLRFRAPVHDAFLKEQIVKLQLEQLVEIFPSVPYQDALAEMIRADGLLVLQSDGCNDQIPAKFYEYIRAGRPILALTDSAGDTAEAMRKFGLNNIAPLDSPSAITDRLAIFLQQARSGQIPPIPTNMLRQASRHERATLLAIMLNAVSCSTA